MAPELDHIERRLSAVEKISAKNVAYLDSGEKRLDRFQKSLDDIHALLMESAVQWAKHTEQILQLEESLKTHMREEMSDFNNIRSEVRTELHRIGEAVTSIQSRLLTLKVIEDLHR